MIIPNLNSDSSPHVNTIFETYIPRNSFHKDQTTHEIFDPPLLQKMILLGYIHEVTYHINSL